MDIRNDALSDHRGGGPDNPARRVPAPPPEWGGTGLCAEAQADGVPCTVAGRACDTCARATPAPRTSA